MQPEYELSKGGILMPNAVKVGGIFTIEHRRAGKLIDRIEQPNLVTDEGLNALLNIMFNAATQVGTWYLALFEGNYTPVATLGAAGFASAATETTAYASATRPAFVEATSTAKSTTNSANRASFVFTAAKNIYGAALLSDNTKGGTSGILFSAARFTALKPVAIDDEMLLNYTFNASSV